MKTLIILLDRSGSMCMFQQHIIPLINEIIKKCKNIENLFVTIAQFDSLNNFDITHNLVSIKHIKFNKYVPRALTTLNDSVINLIEYVNKIKNKTKKTQIIIITDGLDNKSVNDININKALNTINKNSNIHFSMLQFNNNNTNYETIVNNIISETIKHLIGN